MQPNTKNSSLIFRMLLKVITVLSVGALGVGCGVEANPELLLNGTIQSLTEASDDEQGVEVTLAWANFFAEDSTFIEGTGAEGLLPINFSLPISGAPAEGALNDATLIPGGEGAIGFAYIAALSGQGSDAALRGLAPEHVVVYAADLNEEALSAVGEIISNPAAIQPGYNLARAECNDEGGVFDTLRIVSDEDVVIESADENASNCLNFF